MAEKKPISVFGAFLIAVVAMGAIYFWTSSRSTADSQMEDTAQKQDAASIEIDVAVALKDRILGDPNAPLKISEHSSFTCGHCGNFHKQAYKQIKAAYIDTGKAYLVFSDFPLNAPALHATMAARCLPEEKFFEFSEMLFSTQKEWAHERNYSKILQEKAAAFGMDEATFKSCIANEELQKGIVARQRAAQSHWEVNSTPTIVLNNTTTIKAGQPFESLKKVIDEELAKAEGRAP